MTESMGMSWTLTDSLDDYLAAAGGFLRSRPVQNTVQLAAAETLRARGASAFGETAPLFGWWRSVTGEVTAALLHTPALSGPAHPAARAGRGAAGRGAGRLRQATGRGQRAGG